VRRARAAAVAVPLLVLTAACGTAPEKAHLDAQDRKAAANLSREYQSEGFTAADADCLSHGWVARVGSGDLVKAGLLERGSLRPASTSKKPSRTVVQAYADSYFACVDYGRYEAIKFDKQRPGIINQDQFAACADKIDKADAKRAMVDDLLQKDTAVSTKVLHELLLCANA
jgi:hypothetical protein